MGKKFKAIAFDLDGTLIDTEPFYRELMTQTLQQKFGYQLTGGEYDQYYLGLTTARGTFNILQRIFGRVPTAIEVEDTIALIREIAMKLREEYQFKFFDGALELLAWCKEHGIPNAIVTNAKRTTLEKYAEHYQLPRLLQLVDHLITTLDVNEPKPHPAIYLKAAEVFGVDPSEMLVVEDTVQGIEAGRSAGAFVIRVNSELPGEADHHFKTIGELFSRLPEFFG